MFFHYLPYLLLIFSSNLSYLSLRLFTIIIFIVSTLFYFDIFIFLLFAWNRIRVCLLAKFSKIVFDID